MKLPEKLRRFLIEMKKILLEDADLDKIAKLCKKYYPAVEDSLDSFLWEYREAQYYTTFDRYQKTPDKIISLVYAISKGYLTVVEDPDEDRIVLTEKGRIYIVLRDINDFFLDDFFWGDSSEESKS